jgi:hypothetical protein
LAAVAGGVARAAVTVSVCVAAGVAVTVLVIPRSPFSVAVVASSVWVAALAVAFVFEAAEVFGFAGTGRSSWGARAVAIGFRRVHCGWYLRREVCSRGEGGELEVTRQLGRKRASCLSIRSVLSASSPSPPRLPFTPTFRCRYSCLRSHASFSSSRMMGLIDRLNSPPVHTLQVIQPTSSTITYTVSTRPIPKTLAALVGYYGGICLRVILGVTSILLLWLKWRATQAQSLDVLLGALGHEAEGQLVKLTEACQWRYLIPSACVILFLVFRRNYTGGFRPCLALHSSLHDA